MPVFLQDDKHILFVHIPKTGGSTIERLFRDNGYKVGYLDGKSGPGAFNHVRKCSPQHMHGRPLNAIFRMSRFDVIFMLVRDPIDRFRSEFLHRTVPGAEINDDVFNDWTAATFSRYAANNFVYDNHIRPQHEFNVTGCVVYRYEDGMEHIRSDLNERYGLGLDADMPTIRQSQAMHGMASSEVAVPEQAARRIVEFYHQDYVAFDFSLPDSYASSDGYALRDLEAARDVPIVPASTRAYVALKRVFDMRLSRSKKYGSTR
jgi:hypothetical protein